MPKPATKTTEVIADPKRDRRQRRRFTPEYKARMLAEADACASRGEVGALLRREGLYSSHLSEWRKQVEASGSAGLEAKVPGRKPAQDERDRAIEKLERDKARLERELDLARKLLDLAGKAHEILGVALPSLENEHKR
jgi:transposase-like protein